MTMTELDPLMGLISSPVGLPEDPFSAVFTDFY